MPIVGATWATLPQVVGELEKDGVEILQVLESPDGLAVLYRPAAKWESRKR